MKFTLKFYIRWASAVLGALWLQSLTAQTVHISHCLAGCPAGAPVANEIVVRHLFAASINYQSGLADWVAYRVLPDSVGVASLLLREWKPDQLLALTLPDDIGEDPQIVQPDISNLQDRDYRINEMIINPADQGRLVPMSSFAGTPYWADLNYLSNMAPLPADLRIGPWSRLDQAVNELAGRAGELFVISGPLYGNIDGSSGSGLAIGDEVRPSAFFKFIARQGSHAAFIFPYGVAQHSTYCERISTINRLQELSGLELLPLMPDVGSNDLYKMLGCNLTPESE